MALRLLYSIAILITFIQLVHMQDCPQDVVFIVDRASYIGSSSPSNDLTRNWNLIKTFLSSVAGRLNFGATNTQLATVTFGNNGNVAFSLTASASTATNGINNLDYNLGGGSNIADAFQVTRTSVLSTTNGKRSGVPSICLLLVTYPAASDTTQERNQLTPICRLIVLTASQIDRVPSLNATFRNYPTSPADFYQATFDELSSADKITQIVNSIIIACPTTPTPPSTSTTTTTTLPPPTGCSGNTPADVIIVMDSSGSIDAPNFEKAKAFVGSLIRSLNADGGGIIRVGLLTFSDTYRRYFFLNTFTTRTQMLAALNNVTYVPGATNTGMALNYVRTEMLTSGNGDRPEAPNIVLLLTDGGSTDRRATSTEAALLRNTGAVILLIGTGNWLYDPEMYAIAGYPSSTIRYINDYNNLLAAVADYVALICQNVKACSSNPCQNGGTCADIVGGGYVCQCTSGFGGQNCEQTCRGKYDVVFAIDVAWCLSFDDFRRQLEFYRSATIGLSDTDFRVGALVYSKVANITFNLGDFSTNRKLNALRSFSTLFSGGETNISAPIATAQNQMFTTAGDRPDADNILVILTADMSADINATVRQAMAARNANTKIVVVTVGNRYSPAEVEGIASYPVANNIFNITDFSSLTGILNRFTQTLCNNINECSSNPCQNGGTCTDLLNGYQCACDSTHTGVNCERANSGVMDVVFALDTSGMSTLVINFIISVLENLEISGTKTRVGCLIYSSTSTSVFELNTYMSKQDVIWAMKQIAYSGVFSSSMTTNTASALAMLRDVKFTSANGDRSNAQNFALFFTNINSNVNPTDSVPNAIRTRISNGGIYIITFGIGSFVYLPELVAISSVAGYPVLLVENSLTIFKANSFADLPNFLTSYLNAFLGDQSNKCNSNPCMNGGTCLNDVKKFTCQCQADFGGETCSRRCSRSFEVAIVLDISGSGDVVQVVDWNINLARQIVLGLPIRPGRVSLGVVTFGNGSSVSFYLNSYNSKDDILNALSFRLATGPNGLQAALQTLTSDFFTSAHGSSGSVSKVAVVMTSSDTPSDYSGIVQAATAARNANIEIYAVSLGNGPNMAMINAIASNSTANHVFSGSQTSDIATIAGNFLTILCQ